MPSDLTEILFAAIVLAAMFVAMVPFTLREIRRKREARGFEVLPVDRKPKGN